MYQFKFLVLHLLAFSLLVPLVATSGQYEGENCDLNDGQGVCRQLNNCLQVKNAWRDEQIFPQICSYKGWMPIVCCKNGQIQRKVTTTSTTISTTTTSTTTLRPNPTSTVTYPTTSTTTTSTTTFRPNPTSTVSYPNHTCVKAGISGVCRPFSECKTVHEAWLNSHTYPHVCSYNNSEVIVCCPITETTVQTSTNHVPKAANQKCVDYAKQFGQTNTTRFLKADSFTSSDTDVSLLDFPHMALIGNQFNDRWQCAGSLISEKFVLTSASCTYTIQQGMMRYVWLGISQSSSQSPMDGIQTCKVLESYVPKTYKIESPSPTNDIGLLELEKPVQFTRFVYPACLFHDVDIPRQHLLATCWDSQKEHELRRVALNFHDADECTNFSNSSITYTNGNLSPFQICPGTCQTNMSTQLQILSKPVGKFEYIYSIIAVASPNNTHKNDTVYTRISAFLPWIESIVWQ